MRCLNPTPDDKLCDAMGRPYFLWDEDTSLPAFERRLREGSDEERALDIGKLMRQAKPDDVFRFVSVVEIARLWPHVARNLGMARGFWSRLLETLEELGLVAR